MPGTVTVIRMRWWGHLLVLICLVVFPLLGAATGSTGLDLLREPDGWWKGLLLLTSALLFGFLGVMLLDLLFTYRLEIGARGIRIIGNIWRRDIVWEEITRISRRHNPRGIGYHVLIEVDGSHLPRRHWSRLWFAGYQVPTPMEKSPTELAAYLKRKRRDCLKRADDGAETA